MTSATARPLLSLRSAPPATVAAPTGPAAEAVALALDSIDPNPTQPRRDMDPATLAALASSLSEKGLLQPILVRPHPTTPGHPERYELIAGQRRLAAARRLGWTTIPARVRSMDDGQAREAALVENLQRQDLNPIDETEAVLSLVALRVGVDSAEARQILTQARPEVWDNVVPEAVRTQVEAIFVSLGRMNPASFRRHRLPLLDLPEDLRHAVARGVDYTKVQLLAHVPGLEDATARAPWLERLAREDWSLAKLRQALHAPASPVAPGEGSAADGDPTEDGPGERLRRLAKEAKAFDSLPGRTRRQAHALLGKLEGLLGAARS